MPTRRHVSLLLAALLGATSLTVGISGAHANGCIVGNFAGGTGSTASPFLVSNHTQITYLASDPNCFGYAFRQTANIALTAPWTPIGSYGSPFLGVYDGGGYSNTGLSITGPTSDFQGLFGAIRGATIQNINVTGSISARNGVGGLVGRVFSGVITNARSEVNVSGTANIGGLVGGVYDEGAGSTGPGTSIRFSSASGNVSGQVNIGGLIGSTLIVRGEAIAIENSSASGNISIACVAVGCGPGDQANGGGLIGSTGGFFSDPPRATGATTITNSWATGNVSATTSATSPGPSYAIGGLIGEVGSARITNSFAAGNVQGANYVGGIAGKIGNGPATGGSSISDSYFTGSVTGAYQTGGLIGEAAEGVLSRTYSSATINLITPGGETGGFIGIASIPGGESMWDVTTSGQTSPGVGTRSGEGVTGKTTAEMKLQSTYSGIGWSISPFWDGGTTWAICSAYNNGYPYLVSTVAANPSGCALAPVPDPAPAPTPEPTATPTATPTPEPTPTVVVDPPASPVFQEDVRPLAPGVEAITGEIIAVTVPIRANAPAGTTAGDAPRVTAKTGEIIRVSIDGLAASSEVSVAIRINGRWVRLGTANTGVKGRTTLPAFETTVPGDYLMRIKGKGTGTRFVMVNVS